MLRFRARLAVVAAAALALGSLSAGAQATAAASLYAPWWHGYDCDSAHWNSVAASLGWNVTLNPSHPLGASYRGIEVCGPRPGWDKQGTMYAPNVAWGKSGWAEYEWQCVELAQRFMAQIYGTTVYGANGWNVVTNYKTAYGGSLTKFTNPTVGKVPRPGDIIQFGTTSPGHTVVVASTTVDASGNGTLTVMSQNDGGSSTGWRTLTVSAWKVGPIGTQPATMWLHQNVITFSELPLGTIVSTQYKGQGIVFSRYGYSTGSPYNGTDQTSPTSPILSGTPAYHGGIKGTFVVAGTTTPTTVGSVQLDVGHITAANTIRITFFNATGGIIKSVLISSTGVYRASAVGAIASFVVYEATAGVGTLTIDNVVSAPNYT